MNNNNKERMKMKIKIPCNKLQSHDIQCDIPAKVNVQPQEKVGYVSKGCGCGRVTAGIYKWLPKFYRR